MKRRRPSTLRIITLNLWNEQGDHEARLRLCAEQLGELEPDVIALQEVRERGGVVANQARGLLDALGMKHHAYCPVAEWGGGIEGLAILSRWPLTSSRQEALPDPQGFGPRCVLGATIESPSRKLAVATTHLAYETEAGPTREAQATAASVFARTLETDSVRVLCGDLNATPDSKEVGALLGSWKDAYAARHAGVAGVTWAAANPNTARSARLGLDRRLDYLLFSPAETQLFECEIVLDRPTEVGLWPSDHYGLLADLAL